MKYIIVEDQTTGLEHAILFPSIDIMSHKELARRIPLKTTSAGFVTIIKDKAHTYGESISLNMKPRQEDARIIDELLGENP